MTGAPGSARDAAWRFAFGARRAKMALMKRRVRVKRLRRPPSGTVLRDGVDASTNMHDAFVVLLEPRDGGFWRAKVMGGAEVLVHFRAWS